MYFPNSDGTQGALFRLVTTATDKSLILESFDKHCKLIYEVNDLNDGNNTVSGGHIKEVYKK
ncbi:MAG: hypothetical protein IPI59_15050 [Sphingobacteriales bacterium]|nr:hypothetical protein [Sphingobacteriales bacterium]MBP9140584.1 hypothetical protein [Chitinophagales bacterium]MDA0197374.1 hypothetical protein [Bacteroidota bacterium]MBK7528815.1 hypothetical protein [Sphingobacteriales bacterium]MBL0246922.1 hypothetical protein [Sphingobacteriales bacterium]